MKWKEKRKLERFSLELPAQIRLLDSQDERTIKAKTSNICSGGAYFRMSHPLSIGTAVRITLHLSLRQFGSIEAYCGGSEIKMTGKVSRRDASGISVLFDSDYQIRPLKSKTK